MTEDVVARLLLQVSATGDTAILRLSDELAALDKQMVQLSAMSAAEVQSMARLDAATVSAATSLKTSEASLSSTSKSIGVVGATAGLAGLAITGFAVKSAIDFDTAKNHVLAFTGTTKEQLDTQVTPAVIALSEATGKSATEIMTGFYNIASSGLDTAKSLVVMTNAERFAAASQTDSAVATQLLTAVTNAYHLSLADIPKAQNDITQAVLIGTMEAKDYSASLGQVIPVAAHLGVSLKDLGAWYAVLTNNGVSAAESGVYVGAMLNHLLTPTFQQMKAVEALGGSYKTLTIQNGDVGATLERINKLVQDAVPNLKALENAHGSLSQRQQIFIEMLGHADEKVRLLFGGSQEAEKAWFALMDNGGKQTSTALGKMQNDAQATDTAFKTSMSSVANQLLKAEQAAKNLSRELAGPLLTAMTNVANESAPLSKGLGEQAKAHQDVVGGAEATVGSLLLLSLGIRTTKYFLDPLVAAWGALKVANYEYLDAAGLVSAALPAAPFAALAATIGIGVKETHDASVALQDNITWLEKHREVLTSDQQALLDQYKANSDSRGLWQAVTREMPQMIDEVKKRETATRADTAANREYAAQRAAVEQQERKTTLAGDGSTESNKRQKKSVDELKDAYKGYESELSKAQSSENDALASIAQDLLHHVAVSQQDLDIARQRETVYSNLNDAMAKAQNLVDGDTEALSRFTTQMKILEDQGLVSHTASMTAFADVGISQAQRMHAGVVSEVTAMMHEVATAEAFNPIAAPPILGGPAPIVTTSTEHSHSTGGSTPATSEITPEAQQALADLNKTIQSLPSELQGLLSGVSSKFSSDIQTSYNSFLDKYNAENTRDAAAKQSIVNDEHQKIADAYASAESKDKADHDDYLSKLKALQDSHNQDLSSRLTTFVQQFQQVLANFQASLATEQTKAQDITQTHNDKLQQLYSDYTSKLQGIHGKNADERKQALEAQYSRAVQLEDTHYQNSIRAEEQHITGMTGAFDRHVKGMDASFNQGASKSEASYKANQEALANGYLAHVTGIKTALDASVKKSEESAGTSLSKEATIHKNHVDSLNAAFEKHVASLSASLEKGLSPDKLLATLKTGASDAYNAALAQGTLDELNTGSLSSSDAASLQTAIDNQNELSDAEKRALATVTSLDAAMHTFAETVKSITDRLASDEDTLARLIYTGHTSDISQSTAPNRRVRSAENMGASDLPTVQQATVTDLVQAYKDNEHATESKTQADVLAAKATDDWTTVLADSQAKVKSDTDQAMASLTHLLDSDVSHSIQSLSQLGQVAPTVAAQLQRSASEQEQSDLETAQAARLQTQAMIQAAQAAGDLSTAFDKLKSLDSSSLTQSFSALEEHFRTGAGNLSDLEAAYQRNKAEVDLDTQAETQAYEATGQYSDALKALTDGPTKAYSDALAKVTLDILQHGSASQSDIAAAQQARAAKDADTRATWDATFATSSLADQSKMLSQKFSEIVSRDSTISGAQQAVDSAGLAVLTAQSALAVQGIQAEATATQDLVGIVSANQAITAASGNAQVAAITDQTKVLSDSFGIEQASYNLSVAATPQAQAVALDQLAQAREQVAIDRLTAQEHQAQDAWQRVIATDSLHTALDKASSDRATAAAQSRVLSDSLQVAIDSRQLAVDQQKLTIDQLTVLSDISSSLGSVTDYGTMIQTDLTNLDADRQAIYQDQLAQASDQGAANALAAYNAQVAANDSLLTASDQGGLSSTTQWYEVQLAVLAQQMAGYKLDEQRNQLLVQQLAATQQAAVQQQSYWMDLFALYREPWTRDKFQPGMSTAQQMDGNWLQVQMATNTGI